jgi:phosphatidylglycerophosphate synthase
MALTLADKITLARLVLAPAVACSYLLLPIEHGLCFWVAGWLCAIAEYSDLVDGRIARARGEVSDFGKLADPFCDVFYRLTVFMAYLLPAGGVGYLVAAPGASAPDGAIPAGAVHQLVFLVATTDAQGHAVTQLGAGLAPWLPVLLMVLREIVAGALRAMSAVRGLALAARSSGKLKAWIQGVTLITVMAWPAVWWTRSPWHLTYAFWMTWICAAFSVASIIEYMWVNRHLLAQLTPSRGAAGQAA